MYTSHKQHSLFDITDSEQVGLSACEFSSVFLPEAMHFTGERTDYSFKPLFDANEPLPNLFEKLGFPKSASDLLSLRKQSADQIKRMRRLNKIKKFNKRLLRKIDSILEFAESVSSPSQETGTGALKLTFNKSLITITSVRTKEKRMTDEELRLKLESKKILLLDLLKNWTASSASHKNIIDTMESYKKLVNKYARKYHRIENSADQLCDLLLKAKNAHISSTNSLNSGESASHGVKKRSTKKKHTHVWNQLNLYFMDINQDIRGSLNRFDSASPINEVNIEFLNVASINRLLAIAKMLQYCLDNGITVAEFLDDRTYQKIKARLKRLEETVLLAPPGTVKEKIYCPSLDEIPFLLLLGKDNIEGTIDTLKDSLTSVCSMNFSLKREKELVEISERNRKLVAKISERIATTKEITIPQIEIDNTIFKRRYKKAKCQKRQKLDDSESDTNTTRKEDSLKTTVQSMKKPKFKVIRFPCESIEGCID